MRLTSKILFIFSFTCCITTGYSQTTWKTFNHKNGFTIILPSYFSSGLLVAVGTLQWFTDDLDKEIQLTVESFGIENKNQLLSDYQSEQTTFKKVTYKIYRQTWFVISGEDEMGISYVKKIIRNGIQHELRISYPPNKKAIYDTLLSKISASFQ